MTDRLTDERLEPQIARIWATITDLAELVALRRVAEAAERDVADARAACGHFADVPHCHSAPYDRTCSDCPYDVVYRTDIALAEWRRVRGGAL